MGFNVHNANDNVPPMMGGHVGLTLRATPYNPDVHHSAADVLTGHSTPSTTATFGQFGFHSPQRASPKTDETPPAHVAGGVSVLLWLASLAATGWTVYSGAAGIVQLLAVIVLLWASLALSYTQARAANSVGREVGALSALLAFAGTIYVLAAHFGLLGTAVMSAGVLTCAALGLGYVLHSRICLRAAAFLGLAWLAAGLTAAGAPQIAWGLPLFGALALIISAHRHDQAAFSLSHLPLYGWLGAALSLAVLGGIMPAIHAVCLVMAAAFTEYRAGRYLEQRQSSFGQAMSAWGWIIFMTALIAATDFWLRGDAVPWTFDTLTPLASAGFIMAALAAIFAIILIEIARITYRPQSVLAALCIPVFIAGALFIPAYAHIIDGAAGIIPQWAGVTLRQGIGLIFGGISFALAWRHILTGIRRSQSGKIFGGIAAIMGLSVIALDHILMTPQALIIFAGAALLALLASRNFVQADT
ncbi:hypothetical protein [Robiginitomaculum antarcticum]|uniref:hypothetical protein n=1 Tax=Robiginitomaculum antarcticum TaxID=437507 RepID=UPI00035FF849|nr:hypothetical protein [Robiginitomaculum antarcticum]